MTEYRVVTVWRNVAKIAALSFAAVVAWGVVTSDLYSTVLIGVVMPVVGALIWDTHVLDHDQPDPTP